MNGFSAVLTKLRIISLILACTVIAFSATAQTWTKIVPQPGSAPGARMGATAIYDPVGKRMVVYGGKDGASYLNDVWAFDFASRIWSQLIPIGAQQPAARAFHTAVYDPMRQRMLVWSGQVAGGFPAETGVWAFDLFLMTWQKLGTGPTVLARYGSAAIYEPKGNRILGFGGFGNTGQLNDTYAFDVVAQNWQMLLPLTYVPGARSFHSATYDPFTKRMIIFGGQTSEYLDDLWAFTPDSSLWDSVTTTTSTHPEGRYLTSTVTTQDNQILLFGGRTATGDTNDVWQYSIARNKWTQHTVTGQQPASREGHAAIYRSDDDGMVIFGGSGASLYNDLWEFYRPVTAVGRVPQSVLPVDFVLHQNSPNPFNPTTTISFEIPRESYITLKVFNLLGIEVATLMEGQMSRGTHSFVWDAQDIPSGVYIYRLTAGSFTAVKKMILMK